MQHLNTRSLRSILFVLLAFLQSFLYASDTSKKRVLEESYFPMLNWDTIDESDSIPAAFVNGTPFISDNGIDFLTVTLATSEPSKVYYTVTDPQSDIPTQEQLINGLNFDNSIAFKSGSVDVPNAFENVSRSISDLPDGTSFALFFVTEDIVGNVGDVMVFYGETLVDFESKVVLEGTSPSNFAQEVPVDGNFEIYFTDEVVPTEGQISVFSMQNGNENLVFSLSANNTITEGFSARFSAPQDLEPLTEYFVLIDSGAFISKFNAGKVFNGINDKSKWTFTTNDGSDTRAPQFVNNTPQFPEAGFNFFQAIFSLDEPGNIFYTVETGYNGFPTELQVINGTNALGEPAIASGVLTVENGFTDVSLFIDDLEEGKEYIIYFVTRDALGNTSFVSNGSIATQVDLSNKIVLYDRIPYPFEQQTPVSPLFQLNFSEPIVAGSGKISVFAMDSLGEQEVASIDVLNTQIEENRLSFTLPEPLAPFTTYYVQIDSGLVIDAFEETKAFWGISSPEEWSFTTNDGADNFPPRYVSGTPSISEVTPYSISFEIAINEPGKVFYIVTPPTFEPPSIEQVINGIDINGNPAIASGEITFNSSGTKVSRVINGLDEGKEYNLFLLAEDNLGNKNTFVDQLYITTPFDFSNKVVLEGTRPYNQEEEVFTGTRFEIYFSEEVRPGSGNISVFNAVSGEPVSSIPADALNYEFYQASFGLPNGLEPFTEYFVTIDSGAILSKFENKAFWGIQDEFRWRFTTNDGSDTQPPKYVGNTPFIEDVGFDFFNLQIALSEPGAVHYIVQPNSSQLIMPSVEQVLSGLDGTGTVAAISGVLEVGTAGASQIINVENLQQFTEYRVFMVAIDVSGNFDDYIYETWVKTEADTRNLIIAYNFNPFSGSEGVNLNTTFSIEFSEEVVKNSGNITLFNFSTEETSTINIQDDSLVRVEYSTLFFKPSMNLEPLTSYGVALDSGIVTDISGSKIYQGSSEWYFSTNDGSDNQPPFFVKNTPRFSDEEITNAKLQLALDEPGKVFYIVMPREFGQDSYPKVEEVISGVLANGEVPIQKGVWEIMEPNMALPFEIKDLPEFTEFELYTVNEDTLGNRSDYVQSFGFRTRPDLSDKIVLFDTHPYRRAQEVMPSTFFNLRFSEEIFVSGGKFVVRNWADNRVALEIPFNDEEQVRIEGNEIFILPNQPLATETKYYVQIPPGFITDISGVKPFKGIIAKENWWFITNDGSDIEAPFFVEGTPSLENYTGDSVSLRLAVNEPALVSYILIEEPNYDESGGDNNYQWPQTFHVLEGFDPNTNQEAFRFGSVEMDVNQPVVLMFGGLMPDVRYRAFVVAEDTVGNLSEWPRDAWLRDDGPRGFEVVDAYPFPGDSLVPVDAFFNLVFSESIATTQGNISVLSTANDSLLYTISVSDTNLVNVDENLLFFEFPGNLLPDADHYILFDSAAVISTESSKVFEGANGKDTWFFRTGKGKQPPLFVAETPEILETTTTGFLAEVALNSEGKVYYVVAEPSTGEEFTAQNVRNGRDDFGNEPLLHGVLPIDFPFEPVLLEIEGLASNRFYEVFFAAADLEGRLQPRIVRTGLRTIPELPKPPINFTAFALSSKRVELNWVDDNGEADFYLIFRKEADTADEPILIGEVSRNTRGFEDIDLDPDTRYSYFIVAVNNAGESEASSLAFAKTFRNVPKRPIARKATGIGLNEFTANWDDLPGTSGYLLQVAIDSAFSDSTLVSGFEEVFLEDNVFELVNLNSETTYFYRVFALGEDGTFSESSNFVGVRTLSEDQKCASVTAVTDSILSVNAVQLKWEPIAGVQDYAVRTTIPGTDFERREVVKTAGIILFDLEPATSYVSEIVPVCSVNPLIKGDAFAHTFTTLELPDCDPVTNMNTQVTAVEASITWDATNAAKGYFVAYKEVGAEEWNSQEITFDNAFVISGLTPETEYEVMVMAVCSFQNEHASEPVTTTITTLAGEVTCTVPTEFDVSVEGRKVELTWEGAELAEVQTYVNDLWVSFGEFSAPFKLFEHPTGEFRARIRTVCENGLSAWTDALPYKVGGIAPEAPTALEANAIGRKAIFLTWEDNAENEKGYKIERKLEGGIFRPIAFVERNQNVFTDIALQENTTYFYRVFALNDVQSASSNIAETATLAAPNPPEVAPFDLNVEKATQFSIKLNWKDTATNALGYRIIAQTEEGFERVFNTKKRGDFIIGQLRPSSSYVLKVQSFNEDGTSDFSESITATTASEPVPPSEPVFTAQGVDVDKIFLSWEIDAGAGVKIERRLAIAGSIFEEIATVIDVTEYVDDEGLTENTLYEYRLRAVTADGNSGFAAATQARTLTTVNITAPEAPIAFLGEGVSQTQINLIWENTSNNARGLILERSESGSDFYLVLDTLLPKRQSYQDAGLEANSQFEYRLTAFNSAGNSESVTVEVSTLNEPVPPLAPTALVAEFIGAKRIGLVWTDNAVNEDGFKLYRDGAEINGDIPANFSIYLDEEDLSPDTEYAYVLVAYNQDGEAASDTLKVTTKGAVSSPPQNLTVALGDQTVDATWEAPEKPNGEVLYAIGGKFFIGGTEVGTYFKDSIDATTFAISIPTETQDQIDAVAAIIPNINVEVSIAVTAQNQYGFSAPSNKVNLSFTAAELSAGSSGRVREVAVASPDRLSGYFVSETSTGLAWDDRSQNEDGFIIYRASLDNPFALTEIGSVDADVSEFVDESVTEGVAYNYLVVATLGDEKSGNSNILTFNANGSYRKAEDFDGTEVSAALSFSEGDIGYVLTGSNAGNITGDVWAYNALTDTWVQKTTFPGAERMYATGFYLNGSYYMGLGSDGTQHRNDFWKYDTTTDTWTQLGDFTGSGRAGAVSFVIDGTAYIGTGSDGEKHLKDFWKYDSENDTWTQLGNFDGVSRSGAVAFAIDGKGYIATGDNGSKLSDVWEYDASTDTWSAKADFTGDLIAGASTFTLNDKVYISNGDLVEENLKDAGLVAGNEGFLGVSLDNVNSESRSEQLWEYDPSTDTWKSTFGKLGEGRSAGVAMVVNNRAYVGLGVGNDGFNRFDFVEFSPYTLETDKPEAPTTLVAVPNDTNTAVDLSWNENASDAIEVRIERASEANGNFTVLDTLTAGTVSFTDTEVGNEDIQYFYRVRSVNYRGYSPYSNIADVSITTSIEDALLQQSTQVYPNPSTGLYNLEVALPQHRALTLRVYNSVGSLVSEMELPKERLQFIHSIDLRNESTGVYLLQINSAKGGQHTLRVVKE